MERIISWATVRGLRKGDNPARWRGFLETQLPSRGKLFAPVRHLAALPYTELPSFMAELRKHEGTGARALEFAILTAARTGAVLGATWDEISFDDRLWTVSPRPGAKTDIIRRIPLPLQALQILHRLYREHNNNHVFIGTISGKSISNMTMSKALKSAGYGSFTVHGTCRSSFADWVSECTDYPAHVREAALWHSVADSVERAYRRGDALAKRREMMQAWADYLDGNVIELRARVV
jgi:integrase